MCPLALATVVLAAPPSRAEGVPVADATSAQNKQAAQKLAEGQKLFKAGKLEQALNALHAAHDIVADPQARLLIARAHQNTGDLVKALDEYTATVSEARAAVQHSEKYRETLQSAQRELKELEGVVARVTIRLRYAPPGTHVDIDGEVVEPAKLGGPIVLTPGLVRITAQTPDGRETERRLTLTAGQDAKVELAFPRDEAEAGPSIVEEGAERDSKAASEPAATPGNGKRTAAFVAGGVGVAGLAAFGVFGALSNSKYHQLEDACPNAHCPTGSQSDIDSGKRFQTVANLGLVLGAVGLGTSATLFVLSRPSEPAKDAKAAPLVLSLGFGSIRLRGSFE